VLKQTVGESSSQPLLGIPLPLLLDYPKGWYKTYKFLCRMPTKDASDHGMIGMDDTLFIAGNKPSSSKQACATLPQFWYYVI